MQNDAQGPLTIRDARRDEVQDLFEIDQICFPPHIAYSRITIRFFLRHPSSISKVAEESGKVLGFAVGQINSDARAHVITLDVIPEVRRRRVGTTLMEALHGEFRRHGIEQVFLEVDTRNQSAQKFYFGLGYDCLEVLPNYYQEGSDAFRMMLKL